MTRSLSESLAGGDPKVWAAQFVAAAGFPQTPENLRVVVSWEYAESAGGGGMYNPLNTTQGGYPGETNANGVGVKNYAHYHDGVDACAKVIHNGLYPKVVAAFMASVDPGLTVHTIVTSPWGTRYIHLIDWPDPVHHDPVPTTEEPMLYPSPAKGAVRFSGLEVKGAVVTLLGGASASPPLSVLASNPNPIIGSYRDDQGRAVVVKSDLDEYAFTLS